MSKLRKIMAIVMICVMAISVAGISVMASEEEWITVELDGTKKVVEIEWNLEQDMWHWFEINNKGDDKIKFAIIGTNDQVLPEGVASPGMGIGIGNKSGSEPLPAGKYTMKIESLGESNLKGDFKYKLSVNKPTNDAGGGTGNVVLVPVENDVIRVEDAQDVVFIEKPDTFAMGKLHSYGIIEGDPNGDFRPYSTITRAEMAKVLSKMRGLNPNAPEVPTFSDVNASHWAYSY
ncbi:MAG: S-layer homology domain-containing protein, partial [Clostridia bacterium]|nr:S-layer homology domain-containing protein [Clostridia bacterium]